jgi:hypothetical protein
MPETPQPCALPEANSMETRTIAQRLALAESQVQHGGVRLNRQRTLVKHLERHCLGTFHARRLLRELEETQARFIAGRDQLKAAMDLAAASPSGVPPLAVGSPTISGLPAISGLGAAPRHA